MKIYLAGRYSRRRELQQYGEQLEAAGHTIVSSWIDGHHETRPNVDATGSPAEQQAWALEDCWDVLCCEALILFANEMGAASRGGRFVEFGIALARSKRLMIVGRRENVFCHLPLVEQFDTFADCLAALSPAVMARA